jgi:ectoine hydroxylase-related dioxygenase (phytanoyl-CoA dioxygenase family)
MHQDQSGIRQWLDSEQEWQVWIALDPVTTQSGCMEFVPASHKRGLVSEATALGEEFYDPADIVAVPLAAGGAVAFSSLTMHATGPNRVGGLRRAVAVHLTAADRRYIGAEREPALLLAPHR